MLIKEASKVSYFIEKPLRAFVCGSSQSGKTYFLRKLLENQETVFGSSFDHIIYHYPCFLSELPFDATEKISTPIKFGQGIPTKEEISRLPRNTLVVLDDLGDYIMKSELVSSLYKVISGKREISVISISQNFFLQGPFSREIRNSCNAFFLFRNSSDATINIRACRALGVKNAFLAAEKDTFTTTLYPYCYISATHQSQVSSFRLYTNILDKFRTCYNESGMKGYVIPESEFLQKFNIIKETLSSATYNENSTKKLRKRRKTIKKKESSDESGEDLLG